MSCLKGNLRQTLKMEREFSQNGTGPFWTTLWRLG